MWNTVRKHRETGAEQTMLFSHKHMLDTRSFHALFESIWKRWKSVFTVTSPCHRVWYLVLLILTIPNWNLKRSQWGVDKHRIFFRTGCYRKRHLQARPSPSAVLITTLKVGKLPAWPPCYTVPCFWQRTSETKSSLLLAHTAQTTRSSFPTSWHHWPRP